MGRGFAYHANPSLWPAAPPNWCQGSTHGYSATQRAMRLSRFSTTLTPTGGNDGGVSTRSISVQPDRCREVGGGFQNLRRRWRVAPSLQPGPCSHWPLPSLFLGGFPDCLLAWPRSASLLAPALPTASPGLLVSQVCRCGSCVLVCCWGSKVRVLRVFGKK